jgi:hypothetical protein
VGAWIIAARAEEKEEEEGKGEDLPPPSKHGEKTPSTPPAEGKGKAPPTPGKGKGKGSAHADWLALLGDVSGAVTMEQSIENIALGAERDFEEIKRSTYRDQVEQRERLLGESATAISLFDAFLGGVTMSTGDFLHGLTPTQWETLHAGVPAAPSTLRFAHFLAENCSRYADAYLHHVFDYTSSSSNQLDAFANHIQSFVSKVQSFLTTTKQYSGPHGIALLEAEFKGFVNGAEKSLVSAIEPVVAHVVDATMEKVKKEGRSLDPQKLLQEVEAEMKRGAGDVSELVSTHLVVFHDLQTLFANLMALLPSAVTTVKEARAEVVQVAQNIASIFNVFEVKGPEIFNTISTVYKVLWITYFVLLCLLTCGILWYAFWASGWMGGPKAADDASALVEDEGRPRTFWDRMCCCCNACLSCASQTHDWQICFWSCVIIFQIIVLLVFLVAIVLSLLAGVKAFIGDACEQIYMLNQAPSCFNVLKSLKDFVSTFAVDPAIPLEATCNEKKLLICETLGPDMKRSVILTTCFSFLAAIFQFQLVVDSAILHERSVGRRELGKLEKEG